MATAAEKARLLEGIAFIRSHREQWDQSYWVNPEAVGKCGTVGCLAGHIAITLNRSRPVVRMPAEVARKAPSRRTKKEQVRVDSAVRYSELVVAVKADNPVDTMERTINGRTVRVIHVRDRALRLIGAIGGSGSYNRLFTASNRLTDIYRIAAEKLGISVTELKEECDRIADKRGWTAKASG